MELKKQIGSEIKRIRESLKLSQEAFAEKIEIDVTFLSGVENGHRNITLNTLEKISTALNTNILSNIIPLEKEVYKTREEYIKNIEDIIQRMDMDSLNALYILLKNQY